VSYQHQVSFTIFHCHLTNAHFDQYGSGTVAASPTRDFNGASNSERNAGPVAKLGRGQQDEHKFCCGLQSETFGYSLYMVSSLYKLNKMSAGRSLCFCFISGTNKGIADECYSILI
jgi:hypothetical protein